MTAYLCSSVNGRANSEIDESKHDPRCPHDSEECLLPAVSLATSGARGSYEISSVDEMFFIMETSCSRAFGTRNPEVAEFLLRAVDAQLLRVVDQIQRDLQRAIGGSVLSRALVSVGD